MANPTILKYTAASIGLNPASFVALACPVNCSGYMLKNNGPDTLYMRSDPNDANTEDSMGAGFYEDLNIGQGQFSEQRFMAGQVLYWVKGTGPVIGKFWF